MPKVKKGWIERYEVIGSQGDLYIVARKADGSYGCSCPHWKFHKAPKPNCKHIKAMLRTTVEVELSFVRPDIFSSGLGRRFRGEDGNLIMKEERVAGKSVGIIVEKVEVDNTLFSVRRRFRDL